MGTTSLAFCGTTIMTVGTNGQGRIREIASGEERRLEFVSIPRANGVAAKDLGSGAAQISVSCTFSFSGSGGSKTLCDTVDGLTSAGSLVITKDGTATTYTNCRLVSHGPSGEPTPVWKYSGSIVWLQDWNFTFVKMT